ncbi:MAG: hypothetical protein ACRDBG_13825 [Waterburya sp.]
MAFVDLFTENTTGNNCNTILNTGALILFANITCPAVEPVVYTITAASAGVVNATTLSLTSNATGTYLREGAVLQFGSNFAVVAANITIGTTATSVAVRPLTAAIAANATASTWGMAKVIAPTNIPITLTSNKQDSTSLSDGIYGSSVKTKVMSNPQITTIGNPQDKALYDTILDAANSDAELYAVIARASGMMQFGRVMVENFTNDGNQSDFEKPQFTLDFQGKIGVTTLPAFLTTTEKAQANALRSLAGLPLFP